MEALRLRPWMHVRVPTGWYCTAAGSVRMRASTLDATVQDTHSTGTCTLQLGPGADRMMMLMGNIPGMYYVVAAGLGWAGKGE